jgi:hypothetical protein
MLADELAKTGGVVLVCWQHKNIADIMSVLAPGASEVPNGWPSDRFNVVLQLIVGHRMRTGNAGRSLP